MWNLPDQSQRKRLLHFDPGIVFRERELMEIFRDRQMKVFAREDFILCPPSGGRTEAQRLDLITAGARPLS